MSWVRVWIHLVFSTKNRIPYLKKEARSDIFKHIRENAYEKKIWLDKINGYEDYVHCLISLQKEQTISKVVQLIKGESSFWINKNKILLDTFYWQDDYWAVSISESHLKYLRKYIDEQEEYHKKKSFVYESENLMRKYGWTKLKDLK